MDHHVLLPELIEKLKKINCPHLNIMNRKGETGYIDFIEEKELGANALMKGLDCIGRPFIAIKAEYLLLNGDTIPTFSTFFQRYSDYKNTWQCCGHDGLLLMNTEGGMRKEQFEILNELLYEKKVVLDLELMKKGRFIDYSNKYEDSLDESNYPIQVRLRV